MRKVIYIKTPAKKKNITTVTYNEKTLHFPTQKHLHNRTQKKNYFLILVLISGTTTNRQNFFFSNYQPSKKHTQTYPVKYHIFLLQKSKNKIIIKIHLLRRQGDFNDKVCPVTFHDDTTIIAFSRLVGVGRQVEI